MKKLEVQYLELEQNFLKYSDDNIVIETKNKIFKIKE